MDKSLKLYTHCSQSICALLKIYYALPDQIGLKYLIDTKWLTFSSISLAANANCWRQSKHGQQLVLLINIAFSFYFIGTKQPHVYK